MFFYCHAGHATNCDDGRKAMSQLISCFFRMTNDALLLFRHIQSMVLAKVCLYELHTLRHFLRLVGLWEFCALLRQFFLFLFCYILLYFQDIVFLLLAPFYQIRFFYMRLYKGGNKICIYLNDHLPFGCVCETILKIFQRCTICKFSCFTPLIVDGV